MAATITSAAGPPLQRGLRGTNSRTLADMLPLAVAKYGDAPAARHKVDGDWVDTSFIALGEQVREIALGLVDLGIAPGDRVAILAHTRPEWTQCSFAIHTVGGVLVTIYQTNSAAEVQYVVDHADARLVFAEDAGQLEKLREVWGQCAHLEHVVVIDPADAHLQHGEYTLDELRERGRTHDEAEWKARYEAVKPGDVAVSIYTSGTTGPPKGCLLTHANYRMTVECGYQTEMIVEDECAYLFLPLAHGFAFLVMLQATDSGGTIAYWSRDLQQIVAELREVAPTFFPSVPRIFEKIHALAVASGLDAGRLEQAVEVGITVRRARARGEQVSPEMEHAFAAAEHSLYSSVRSLFGDRITRSVTGGAPIAPEILRFFYACGIPLMEGFGMTETATLATLNRADDFRFGSVGKPAPGVELQIAADGELLIRGENIFRGYYKNDAASRDALNDGWLHTGDLARIDEDGFLYITGRKKDIIITAGGKNVTPANLESDLKLNGWVSQAVVVGDRRPYLVALLTLDPEEAPARAHALGVTREPLGDDPLVQAEIQRAIDHVNESVGPVEQIKRFVILPHDFSQDAGELTPSLKVKRSVIVERYGGLIDELYSRER
jgi:long-chain acyl-CoA synthetase